MATADIDDTLTDERAALAGQPKKHDHEQAVHLDKVTDYVEEQEIFGDVGKAVSEISSDLLKDKSLKDQRDKELAKVVIRKEDVELITRELEIPKSVAERSLREHMGDVV
ncbi:huntingtin-interacting protein K-like [Gigantopelta aegis]|uniref:huntingtin-interacting protein K-like n=1 Tax=Gigantopelta aegis TaxID=1735272 RepID=UPI001B88B757|nr:huntingtin-interacting protein K-like [Gigantopelta aegis]